MTSIEQFPAWLDAKLATPDRESHTGVHYIEQFMKDPYDFYLKYVRGLKPLKTKPALIKGGIIHTAIEAAYTFADRQAAKKTLAALFKHRRAEYAEAEQHTKDWQDSQAMLNCWLDTWLDFDLATYHILHLEEQFELPLPNNMLITVKPDIIVQRRSDGEVRALDHKTTGYSLPGAHQNLAASHQASAYNWALHKLYPNNRIAGLESDVIYKRQSVVKAQRPGLIQRTEWFLSSWEINMCSWLEEIGRRVALLSDGYPPDYCFPRGESYWLSDYDDIYWSPLPEDGSPPYGYEIDAWASERNASLATITEEATQ